MSRTGWIAIVVVAVIAIAGAVVVINKNDEPSKAEAASTLCVSLKKLGSSVTALTQVKPGGTTKDQLQSNISTIKSDWNQVKSDVQDVKNAPTGDLDSAWSSFVATVKSVPSASSVQAAIDSVKQSGQQLVSAAKSTESQLSCS
jgi:hypothetical protein